MPQSSIRRSPLPYDLLAGVVPCPGGWLVVGGRLVTTTLSLEPPQILPRFADVIDYRPEYRIITTHAPLGLLEKYEPGGRACDRAARRLLGHPRRGAVVTPPSRQGLEDPTSEPLSTVARYLLPRYREVAVEMQPYRQRQVYEVHPEVSFYQINENRALRYTKRSAPGLHERRALLEERLGGLESLLSVKLPGAHPYHLLDAAAALWTARRVAARAVTRLPEDPEWDDQGLVMQILR